MSQSLDEMLDTPLTEEQLDGLRRLDAISEGDLQVMAIRAVREIVRLREALRDGAVDSKRCPACNRQYATEEQRERPEQETPPPREPEWYVAARPASGRRNRGRRR